MGPGNEAIFVSCIFTLLATKQITYSHLPQANTARVIFSWNDVDPTMPDGSDAMQHTTRGSASLNLLGGLSDPPPEPSDTRSFAFTVNNVRLFLLLFVVRHLTPWNQWLTHKCRREPGCLGQKEPS